LAARPGPGGRFAQPPAQVEDAQTWRASMVGRAPEKLHAFNCAASVPGICANTGHSACP